MKTMLLISLALTWFTLPPDAQAVCQDACLTNNNTAQGDDALISLTTGTDNTALGFNALLSDTTGIQNIAVGSQALTSDTTGGFNVAIRYQALFSSQSGGANTAIGHQALYTNISGNRNTAIGTGGLYTNQASDNTAIGWAAATLNTSGNSNTAVGSSALYVNQGSNNCAFGAYAMGANVFNSGSNNTVVGTYALENISGSNNTAIGYNAGLNAGGNNNIFIGASAGYAVQGGGGNNIEIGAMGQPGDQGNIRIGTKGHQNTVQIAGIYGRTIPQGVPVVTDSFGRLGTVISSARFKEDIQPMDKASEAILSLKPVTFRYKKELDSEGVPQFGLVAEDVEKVNPDLVACDEQGKPYTVRYEAVNAMLLSEFLKEHRKVQEQDTRLTKQEALIARQQRQIDALTVGLQKVSPQLELSKAARKRPLNNQ